jgi:hypothetical protein
LDASWLCVLSLLTFSSAFSAVRSIC